MNRKKENMFSVQYFMKSMANDLHKCCQYLCVVMLLFSGVPAHAARDELQGVHYTQTRVVYPENARNGVSVMLDNNGTEDMLIQAYVRRVEPDTGAPAQPDRTLMVLPPLVRVNAHDTTMLRLLRVGADLPVDRESVFYLTSRMLPVEHAQRKSAARSRLVLEMSMKIFYRPAALPKGGLREATGKLQPQISNSTLTLHNPTPFWLPLRMLSVEGNTFSAETLYSMVPPFGQHSWSIPSGLKVSDHMNVSWVSILESGVNSKIYSSNVRREVGSSK